MDLVLRKENSLGMQIAQGTQVINARWWQSICAYDQNQTFFIGNKLFYYSH
jgi:hypothetical protein